MARQALIFLLLLTGCQSIEERAHDAAVVKGEAQAQRQFPDLPEACTAKTGRVKPQPGEPRVVTLKRWEIVADNRDRQAADCAAWGADMKAGTEKGSHREPMERAL
jgi:hypothetical protein